MTRFPWGKLIATFKYDFDGQSLEVIKYHPHKYENGHPVMDGSFHVLDKTKIMYSVENMSQSFDTMDQVLIAWIINKNLGQNQYALVAGIVRAISK